MKVETYNNLLNGAFGIDFNCNDYFYWACAMSVHVQTEDIIQWILPFIEENPKRGLDVCLSYIQNQKPIDPWITKEFSETMDKLLKIAPEVISDDDYGHEYNHEEIVYRKVKI